MTVSGEESAAWLVLGGIHLLNGTAPLGNDDVLVQLLVPPAETDMPSNTIVLTFAELGTLTAAVRAVGSGRRAVCTVDGAGLFPAMRIAPRLAEQVTRVGGRPDTSIVPLCYVRAVPGSGGALVHAYSQIRFLDTDACFIRITPRALPRAGVDDVGWLHTVLDLHAEQSTFLNSHQRYYRKCFPGQELEHKYTLAPPQDIWALTVELYQRLRAGDLPGFRMEYRDEFQAWDYVNHLFTVTAPEAERGYVSFIPTTDGKLLMKRKWFAQDGFARREQHTYGVEVPPSLDAYVAEQLGVTATRLPAFRRVRYDVNFESVRTGHVYGIFFDRCSLLSSPDEVLHQCELEYLRSRTAVPPDEAELLAEMEVVACWLEAFLRERGLAHERGHYSKKSFLIDVVARRPELLGAPV